MAAHYRVRLKLRGPVATPLHSGTLFGHLCWALRNLKGEASLTHWLKELPEAPLLISDAFPAGFLPRPLLKPARPPLMAGPAVERGERDKSVRRRAWIAVDDFLSIRGAVSETSLLELLASGPAEPADLVEHRMAHNTIDRITGTTPAVGGLYFMDEWWPGESSCGDRDIYIRTELSAEHLQELFEHTGEHGFGRDASLGRGRFSAGLELATDGLFSAAGNRRLSLSHGTLTPNMQEPRYRLHTHYGKVGSLYSTSERPFKYPITLLRPGATFQPSDGGPFGELLTQVHRDLPQVMHNAWHLAAPYSEVQ